MLRTVGFIFAIKSALLRTGTTRDGPTTSSISFALQHESRAKVTTSAGDDLTEYVWTLEVNDTDVFNDKVAAKGAIGYLVAREDEGRCSASAAIGKATFDRLLTTLESGRMPSQVSFDVTGLQYGKNFEGLDKVWDVEHDDTLITEVRFGIPVGGLWSGAESGSSETQRYEIRDLERRLAWPLYVVAVAVVLICLKLYLR